MHDLSLRVTHNRQRVGTKRIDHIPSGKFDGDKVLRDLPISLIDLRVPDVRPSSRRVKQGLRSTLKVPLDQPFYRLAPTAPELDCDRLIVVWGRQRC